MALYEDCEMESFFPADGSERWPCDVRLTGDDIIVSYVDGGGQRVVYEGKEVEPGHFRLKALEVNGRASLHRFADAELLEGSWSEGSVWGTGRISLNSDKQR